MRRFLYILALAFAVAGGGAAVGAQNAPSSPAPADAPALPAAIVSLDGGIDNYTQADLQRRIERAKAAGAKVVVIDIDSPGGLVTASLEISLYLKRQDGIRTIAFVRNKAYSGAAMVAMACNEIWMAPSSALGDCAPIIFNSSGGLETLPAAERAKQETPIIRDFEDSARRNGYSIVLARAMVDVRQSAYFIEDATGQRRVVDEAEYKKLTEAGGWKPVAGFNNPVDGPQSLLTVYPDEAVALGLAKGTATSAALVIDRHGYRLVADLTPGFGEKLVEMLNGTVVRFLLLLIFLQSLYIALNAPGHGAAEAVATVSLGLLVGVPLLTGYAQWWEVAVIFIGLALCAFEIFVFPGHFVSLILGMVMVLFGLIMTFAGKEPTGVPGWLPGMEATWHGIRNGLYAVVSAFIASFALSLWLRRFLPGIPYFNKLILTTTAGNLAELATAPAGAGAGGTGPVAELWPFIGTVGVTQTDLLPGGSARFPFGDFDRNAAVVSVAGFVPAGTKVFVEQIEGGSVRVRPVGTSESVG